MLRYIYSRSKSNYTNYFPNVQRTLCSLELPEAHVFLGKPQETKCFEKCQSILIHIKVICQYSIEVNWNAVHCCACVRINFVVCRKVLKARINKTKHLKCTISCTQALHARYEFSTVLDYLPLNLKCSDF